MPEASLNERELFLQMVGSDPQRRREAIREWLRREAAGGIVICRVSRGVTQELRSLAGHQRDL